MAELRSESMKTKKKKNLYRRKKPMWKEKIEREIAYARRVTKSNNPTNVKQRELVQL